MLRKIKAADKLFIISKEVDVVKKLHPSTANSKYIELSAADLKEVVKDEAGKTVRSFRLPELIFDGSRQSGLPTTMIVQFHASLLLGAFFIEVKPGGSVTDELPPLPSKFPKSEWLVRIYLLESKI
jgi:phospholipid N-methyltransferase